MIFRANRRQPLSGNKESTLSSRNIKQVTYVKVSRSQQSHWFCWLFCFDLQVKLHKAVTTKNHSNSGVDSGLAEFRCKFDVVVTILRLLCFIFNTSHRPPA
jgi:peptidase E